MFVKINKSKNHTYLQLVESYRSEGKVKHRVAYNFGRLDLLMENGDLAKIATKLLLLSQSEVRSVLELQEHKRLIYGHIVYHRLWNQLSIGGLLSGLIKKSKLRFPLESTLQYLVYNRLLNPVSKHKAYQIRGDYYGINTEISQQHLYRSLDFLAKNKLAIEQQLYQRQRDLFHLKLDVIFYDVTTFHFESQVSDDLRDFGFSKANKINEVQVVMGLLVNQEGRPIGYELFEGNTFEGHTLVKSLQKLNKRFQINKVVIVADKGMHSKKNLHLIRLAGFDYIVSSKIKGANKKIKQAVLDTSDYQHTLDKQTGEIKHSYKSIENEFTYVETQQETEKKIKHNYSDKIIVSWSADRAKSDKKKRERLLQKAKQRLKDGPVKINHKKGAKRYLKTDNDSQINGLDLDKVKSDAKWDGYYAVQYSGQELNHKQVMEQYHFLWKIEESFRVMKSTMKTRPIFHWTPERIKGHFMLCFIAFLLERTLEIKLKNNHLDLSPQAIKEALNSLQISEMELREELFYVKSNPSKEAKKILRALKIKPLNNVTPKEQMKLF